MPPSLERPHSAQRLPVIAKRRARRRHHNSGVDELPVASYGIYYHRILQLLVYGNQPERLGRPPRPLPLPLARRAPRSYGSNAARSRGRVVHDKRLVGSSLRSVANQLFLSSSSQQQRYSLMMAVKNHRATQQAC